MSQFVPYGLYKVKDSYFKDFPSPNDRYVHNKGENRPYYIALVDKNGLMWLLPLSTQVDNYKSKIAADEARYGQCTYYHLITFMGEEKVVLIKNLIPVLPEYIAGEFTIAKQHYVIRNKAEIKEIQTRFSKYLALVRAKKIHPPVDILATERRLLARLQSRKPRKTLARSR